MGRPPLSRDQIVGHPTRQAMLAHLIKTGGRASAVEMCGALDITHRQLLASHAKQLARAKLVRLTQTRRGNRHASIVLITDKGRVAALGDLNVLTPKMPP